MKTEPISDLFYDGGLCIINDSNQRITDLDPNEVISLFEKHGVILFRNFEVDPRSIRNITDRYTESYSQDAPRRAARYDDSILRNVDAGYLDMPLHSETSYSTTWPEIIWFLCLTPAKRGGATTLCDGIKLWNSLPSDLKEFFLFNPIRYDVEVKVQEPNPGKKLVPWSLNTPGTGNCTLDRTTGYLRFTQLRYAVHESRITGKNAFANHLFIILERDPQVLQRVMPDGSPIPVDILKKAHEIAEELTVEIQWQAGDFIMIDNKRFMHGRRAYAPGDPRDIVIVQTKRASFGYGCTRRMTILN